jgi:hypothetical protein
MEVTPGLDFELTASVSAISLIVVSTIAVWRRNSYTRRDFSAVMDRICAAVRELCSVENTAESDTAESLGIQRLCRSLLRNMLKSTCFIANRACVCFVRGADSERVLQVARLADPLILRLRWSLLRMTFRPSPRESCRLTLRRAGEFDELWSAVVRALEARFPVSARTWPPQKPPRCRKPPPRRPESNLSG